MRFIRSLFLIIALFLYLPLLSEERKVALVIGNANYTEKSGFNKLTTPLEDAKAMAAQLKSLGFEISGGKALLDADRNTMVASVEQFVMDCQGADVALFYYSGHGAVFRERDNLLLPVGEEFTPQNIKANSYDLQNIVDIFDDLNCRAEIIILDACRNNPYRNVFGKGGSGDVNGGLKRYKPAEGTVIYYATAEGRTAAQNVENGKYSIFTEAWLYALRSKAYEDINNVFIGVKDYVIKKTRNAQIPEQGGTIAGALLSRPSGISTPAESLDSTPSVEALLKKLMKENEELKRQQNKNSNIVQNAITPSSAPGSAMSQAEETIASRTSKTKEYLHFVAVENNSSVTLVKEEKPHPVNLEYSQNGRDWYDYTIGTTINLERKGDRVYFKNKQPGPNLFSTVLGNYHFQMAGKIEGRGNVMSLIDSSLKNTSVPEYAFNYLFSDCSSLTTAPELPATRLGALCYLRMFNGCKSLTNAPVLPATVLAEKCYKEMFCDCERLTIAPVLPAKKIAVECYKGMFLGCKNLTTAPELPSTELAEGCYSLMFASCSRLTTAPALPATVLADHCYSSMFASCESLTNAPSLPAMELSYMCYALMFDGCTSLTMAPVLPAKKLSSECAKCYAYMFSGCHKLEYIKMLATDISIYYDCLWNWANGVAERGTFVMSKNVTWKKRDVIPSGWKAVIE